jgi:hypothetical protein
MLPRCSRVHVLVIPSVVLRILAFVYTTVVLTSTLLSIYCKYLFGLYLPIHCMHPHLPFPPLEG